MSISRSFCRRQSASAPTSNLSSKTGPKSTPIWPSASTPKRSTKFTRTSTLEYAMRSLISICWLTPFCRFRQPTTLTPRTGTRSPTRKSSRRFSLESSCRGSCPPKWSKLNLSLPYNTLIQFSLLRGSMKWPEESALTSARALISRSSACKKAET